MNSHSTTQPVAVLLNFFKAMDMWEQEIWRSSRESVPKSDVEEDAFRRKCNTTYIETVTPFCTAECISRLCPVTSFGSPSHYGPNSGNIIDCQIDGDIARIVTQGENRFPDFDDQYLFVLRLEGGEWKIDQKKEISESGRQRNVDLF